MEQVLQEQDNQQKEHARGCALTDDNLGCGIAIALQMLLQSPSCLHHMPVPDVPCDVICTQAYPFAHV